VRVDFTLTNHTNARTSGFVRGELDLGLNTVASAPAPQSASQVSNLAPGQTAHGSVLLRWNSDNPPVGMYDLDLQYWDIDPHGSLTLVRSDLWLPPAQRGATTYGELTTADLPLEVYPGCQPNGPDFLSITSFTASQPQVVLDPTGQFIQNGTSVTFSWVVQGGGFPAEGTHPGSIADVALIGPFVAGGSRATLTGQPAVGHYTVNLSGMPVSVLNQPFRLHAFGNCGRRDAALTLGTLLPPPQIVSFSAAPNNGYITAGASATLSWNITCSSDCVITLQGRQGFNDLTFNVSHLSASGQITVHPDYDTVYTLTVTSTHGTDSRTQQVKLYNGSTPTGTAYYFAMTNPNSWVLPCFTLAIFASDEATAKSLAMREYVGYTAQPIDYNEFVNGCN
jgi:hypothetical protein